MWEYVAGATASQASFALGQGGGEHEPSELGSAPTQECAG
jgi:hypothetical protein